RAGATLLASPLRFALGTSSVQPSRFRPSTTKRSACASDASCTLYVSVLLTVVSLLACYLRRAK
ncbi:MAG: hypothetical protein ACLQM8_25760, partial [Limisphaerales bacterium]